MSTLPQQLRDLTRNIGMDPHGLISNAAKEIERLTAILDGSTSLRAFDCLSREVEALRLVEQAAIAVCVYRSGWPAVENKSLQAAINRLAKVIEGANQ